MKQNQASNTIGGLETRAIISPQTAFLPQNTSESFEVLHIQSLRKIDGLFRFANLQAFRVDGQRLSEIVFHRFGPTLSLSRPVKHAYILYSLYKNRRDFYSDRCVYLDGFYRSTKEAIEGEDLPTLVYSSFAASIYACRTGRPFGEFKTYVSGFSASLAQFNEDKYIHAGEAFLLECMREKVVWEGIQRYVFEEDRERQDLDALSTFSPLLYPYKRSSISDQWIEDAAAELELKLQYLKTMVELGGSVLDGSENVIQFLRFRFSRDFVTKINPGSGNTAESAKGMRKTLRALWSTILSFLSHVEFESQHNYRPIPGSLDHILTIVDAISALEASDPNVLPVQNLLEIAICSLVLLGLDNYARFPGSLFGSFFQDKSLMYSFRVYPRATSILF
jgi:hypothetical protein